MKAYVVLAAALAAMSASAVSMSRVGSFSLSGEGDTSGITYAGGNTYYVIDDKTEQLTKYTITLSDAGAIQSVTMGASVATGLKDAEGCAYDPGSGRVWVSDETGPKIVEVDPASGPFGRTVAVPSVFKSYKENYSLEALTISGDGLAMWTANEESLECDGPISAYGQTTTVRLCKFTRTTVHDDWTPAGQFPYTTESWERQYNYSSKARHGVADLCALPDGSLLVLERDLSFSSTSDLGVFFGGSWLGWEIYRVATPEWATDVTGLTSLKGASFTPASKTVLSDDGGDLFSVGNFEGMCLGPRLPSGKLSVLLISDAGDGYSPAQMYALTLSGLDVRTLNFNASVDGSATVVGSNYRFLAGQTVDVALCGPGYDAVAYTNRGDKAVASARWSLPNHTPSSGEGTSMSFTVAADDTLTWNSSLTTASSELLVNETFEEYASDTSTEGGSVRGWTGEGVVVAKAYTPPAVGYPLGRASHEKVLSIEDGAVERAYDVAAANGTKLEMMVSVIRASKPPAADETHDQAAVYVDADGRLRLFHRMDDGTCGWTVLSDDAFANGDWIRLGVEIDYAKATDGHAYLRVWINGNLCTTAVGRATPGGALGGAWHRAACDKASSGTGKISSVSVTGECSIDDVILATSGWPSEGINDVAVDGIPVSWFDEHGLEHDPASVVPESMCPQLSKLGYTIGDIYASGIRPEDDEPLKITAISTEGGKLSLKFNAIRVAPDTVYHVMGGSALGQGASGFSELTTGSGKFDEERQEWRTTWTGDLPAEQKGTGFYFIRATRP